MAVLYEHHVDEGQVTEAVTEAVAEIKKSLLKNPTHSDSHLKLGQFLLIEGMTNMLQGEGPPEDGVARQIVASFERAFELNPADFSAADGLAIVYAAAGAGVLERAWLTKRDAVLDTLGLSLECASTEPLLSVIWGDSVRNHLRRGGAPFLQQ